MIYATRILLFVVIAEVVVGGVLVARRSWRTVPRVPDVELNDPLIMPQLRELARAAEFGTSDDRTRLGKALVGKGFYAHAEQEFREALRLNPRNFDAQFGLAFSLDRTGRMQESSREYRKVTQLAAQSQDQQLDHMRALYAMGRNALREENAAEAEELFQRNAGFEAANYQLAKLRIRSGRPEQALPIIKQNLADLPYSLEFHFLDMRAQQELGNSRAAFEAASMVERSAYLVSMNFNTLYVAPLDQMTGLAPRIGALGEIAGGSNLRWIERLSLEIKSLVGDTPVFMAKVVDDQLLDVAVRSKRPERALELLQEMRKSGREDALMLEHEGDAREMLGQGELAAECWQRALRLTPSIALHRKLAKYHGERDAVQRDWHLGRAALQRGIDEYRDNRLKAAITPLREAAQLSPQDADPWYYLGEVHFHLGRFDEARSAYQQCVQLRPGHGRAAAKLEHLAGGERSVTAEN